MKKENFEQLELDSPWYNLWHAHDWSCDEDGYEDLPEHYSEIGEIFEETKKRMNRFEGAFQCWIIVSEEDPVQDSVYLHTENPHSEFPYTFEDYDWNTEIPVAFMTLAEGRRIGRCEFNRSVHYAILDLEKKNKANQSAHTTPASAPR